MATTEAVTDSAAATAPAATTALANGAAPAAAGAPAAATSASLYVGDLAGEINEAQLYHLFASVGTVVSIRVCRDAVTRRSLGYAYVNMVSVEEAERALENLNGTEMGRNKRPIRIMWSQRDPSLRRSGLGNLFINGLAKDIDHSMLQDTFSNFGNILSCKVVLGPNGESVGHGYVQFQSQDAAQAAIDALNGKLFNGKEVTVEHFRPRKERMANVDTTKFTNVFVKHLPLEWTDDDFKKLFEAYTGVTSCKVAVDEADGKKRGFGFVSFEDPAVAAKVVEELNGKDMGADRQPLYVSRHQNKKERTEALRQKFETERTQKVQSANLYVRNLAEEVTDEILRELFATYGEVTSCKVMRDEKGVSKGFGFVAFASQEDAVRAIAELNSHMLRNKPLFVAVAQKKQERRAQLEAMHNARRTAGRGAGGMGGPGMPVVGGPGYPQMWPAVPPYGYSPVPGQPMPMGVAPQGYPMPFPPGAMGVVQPGMQPGMQPMRRGWGQQQPGVGQMQPYVGMPPYMVPQQQMPGGMPVGVPQQAGRGAGAGRPVGQQPVAVPIPQAQAPLTLEFLRAQAPEQQTQILGERLFPIIQRTQPDLAGKITGMLLDRYVSSPNGTADLLALLDNADALNLKIGEALDVLQEARAIQQRR